MDNTSTDIARLIQGCESEQLHLSGAIQPFGAMLCIDTATERITHASANLKAFLGVEPTAVLGQPMATLDWLPQRSLDGLSLTVGKKETVTHIAGIGNASINATLIRGNGSVLIELEASAQLKEPISFQQHQRPLMAVPGNIEELEIYHRTLLAGIRVVTGFRRCMIYRFQEDWVGEVIAEMADEGAGAYLGLRFPASDIPAIARNLYLLNASRMIPDSAATPVPVLGVEGMPPDLSQSDLRSVSPVHLEYLHNMGVAASFSVPIIVAGQLWGLVACHHGEPRLLSPDQRATCEALTAVYALGHMSYTSAHRLQMIDSLDRTTDRVLESIAEHDDPLDGIERNGELLMKALGASGFAFAVGTNVVIVGDGPDLDGLAMLDDWFLQQCKDSIFLTDHLAEVLTTVLTDVSTDVSTDSNLSFLGVAGFVGVKARSVRSGWLRLYWFRAEEVQSIAWAGNPQKPISENAGAISLSPRRSFERWVETKRGYCHAWSNEQKLVASKFRNGLLRWL